MNHTSLHKALVKRGPSHGGSEVICIDDDVLDIPEADSKQSTTPSKSFSQQHNQQQKAQQRSISPNNNGRESGECDDSSELSDGEVGGKVVSHTGPPSAKPNFTTAPQPSTIATQSQSQ